MENKEGPPDDKLICNCPFFSTHNSFIHFTGKAQSLQERPPLKEIAEAQPTIEQPPIEPVKPVKPVESFKKKNDFVNEKVQKTQTI